MKTKPSTVKHGKVFAIYISEEQLNHVKKMAVRMSSTEGRLITASEAIRMAIEAVYPCEKQMEAFEEKKKRRIKRNNPNQMRLF